MAKGIFALCLLFFSSSLMAKDRVIYGEDNRKDFFEIDEYWADIAKSTVALIDASKIEDQGSTYRIRTSKIADSHKLCPSEAFYSQERAAFCSGALIAPDIVLTAGHCVFDQMECDNMAVIFDFAYKKEGAHPNRMAPESVFFCQEVIKTHKDNSGSDFALIRIDRNANRTPLTMRTSGIVDENGELVVIGHPSGLPTKWADNGYIRNNKKSAYFITTLDTYGSNSGSAVFSKTTGEIEGILVRGAVDYVPVGECMISNVCAEGECRGEDVVRTSEVLPYLDLINTP